MRIALLPAVADDDKLQLSQWAEMSQHAVTEVVNGRSTQEADVRLLIAGEGCDRDVVSSLVEGSAGENAPRLIVVAVGTCDAADEVAALARLRVDALTSLAISALEPVIVALVGQPPAAASSQPEAAAESVAEEESLRQTRVFLSYRRPDEVAMNRVRGALTDHGYRVWWDQDKSSIPAGTFWPSSIEQGIEEADAFVVLVSPNSLKSPKQIQRELYLADQSGKRMVAMIIRPIEAWPDGFGYYLGGLERISMHDNFSRAMDELFAFLGPTMREETEGGGLRRRFGRGRDRLRRFAREHDVAGKVKAYGGTALATAAALAAAAAAAQAQQAKEARARYVEETSQLLLKSVRELGIAMELPPAQFRAEFQPRYQRIMGQLEGAAPPHALAARHRQLVKDLDALGAQFDDLGRRVEAGDDHGVTVSIRQLNAAWSDVVTSNVQWLKSALDA